MCDLVGEQEKRVVINIPVSMLGDLNHDDFKLVNEPVPRCNFCR